jgi:hypothetical protein
MNRCGSNGRPVAFSLRGLAALTLLSAAAVGCGEDELSDDYYGAIDLTPFYADGATAANPRAAIPDVMSPVRTWYKGRRAEVYDFGVTNHRKKRNAAGATINEPDIAYVNQMYFFYDGNGFPMFSKPLYDEQRTGGFYMRGGENMLYPTPRSPNENNQREVDAHYRTPYSQRPRVPVQDADRGNSTSYQRPIIDRLHNDSTYTGLWEIVTVQATGGYKPDSIKSKKTLDSAIEAGDFRLERTLKVINCPVIEEKTFVSPSPMAVRQERPGQAPYMLVQPRIELWYRTKLGFCFLANGFETLGEVPFENNKELDPRFPENVRLFKSNEVRDLGVDTFDVVRYQVGDAAKNQATWVVEARVMKIYTPRTLVARGGTSTSTVRMVADDIIPAVPKHVPWDAPGYSPIVWLHDIDVPQAPAYESGSFKGLEDVDPLKISPRDGPVPGSGGTAAWTKNMPVVGVAQTCTNDGQCAYAGQTCNRFPDLDVATFDAPPGKNMADLTIEREGGPRCDLPVVKYGEYCAPGLSRCEGWVALDDGNDKALAALKVGSAGPNFSVHKAVKDANDIIANPTATPEAKMKAMADLPAAQAKAKWYADRGYDKDYSGRGYSCHPNTGGYCYARCDSGSSSATAAAVTKMLMVPDPNKVGVVREQPTTFASETRCGGLELLGYKCLNNRPAKQRVCLRECTTRQTVQYNNELCKFPLNETKAYPFSEGQRAVDVLEGQSCVALGNATACQWNPDFEPRHPGLSLNQ